MKDITCYIEYSEIGYAICSKEIPGITSDFETFREAVENFRTFALDQIVFYYNKYCKYPEWCNNGNYKLTFILK